MRDRTVQHSSSSSWAAHYEEGLRVKRRLCSIQVTMRMQEILDSLQKAGDEQKAGNGKAADNLAKHGLNQMRELSDWLGLSDHIKTVEAILGDYRK
jgi:hypothetical protein